MGQGKKRRILSYSAAMERFTSKTNDSGRFTFNNLPTGARAAFLIDKAGRAKINTYAVRRTCDYVVGQNDIKLVLPREAKIEGNVMEKHTGKPLAGIKLMATTNMGLHSRILFESNEDGKFHIDSLAPGRYILELAQPKEKLADWIADPIEVDTEAGKTHSGFVLELSKGGVLEVKVRDAGSKQPVEKAYMSIIRQVDSCDYGIVFLNEGVCNSRTRPTPSFSKTMP